MTPKPRALPTILAASLLLLAAACGNDSDDSGGSDNSGDGGDNNGASAPTSTTTTTHPSTEDDEEAAFDIIRDLEAEVDQIDERLHRDPSAVEDPDNPDLQRLSEIVDDEHMENITEALEGLNERGHAQIANSSGVYLETYVYDIASENADIIRYAYCSVQDMVMVDAEGNELDEGFARQGNGIRQAHREDGVWVLAGTETSEADELEPGSTYPGYCESQITFDEDPEGADQ